MTNDEIREAVIGRLGEVGYPQDVAEMMIDSTFHSGVGNERGWFPGEELPRQLRGIVPEEDMERLFNLVNQQEGTLVTNEGRQEDNVRAALEGARFRGPDPTSNFAINTATVRTVQDQLNISEENATRVVRLAREELLGEHQEPGQEELPPGVELWHYRRIRSTLDNATHDRPNAPAEIASLTLEAPMSVAPQPGREARHQITHFDDLYRVTIGGNEYHIVLPKVEREGGDWSPRLQPGQAGPEQGTMRARLNAILQDVTIAYSPEGNRMVLEDFRANYQSAYSENPENVSSIVRLTEAERRAFEERVEG